MRACWALTLGVAVVAAPSLGRADIIDDCVRASSAGQEARKGGKLSDAARKFAQCSQASCPAVVRRDCARWVEEVQLATPTVIFAATDAQGHDRADVRVLLDGGKVLDRLDGRPMSIDPGAHTVRCEAPGGGVASQGLVARVGEKNRLVSMRLEAPAPAKPPPVAKPAGNESHASLAIPLVLGGVSMVALGVAGYFDFSATGDAHSLGNTCGSRCQPGDVDAVETKYRVAAVALGTGVVAAGIALYLFLSSHGTSSRQSTTADSRRPESPSSWWGYP